MKMTTEPGYSWENPIWLDRRINTIPLPKKVKSTFTRKIHLWADHSGSEWTVSRLKSFKDCLMNSYSLGGVLHSKPDWFKTNSAGNLTGNMGDLWSHAMLGAKQLRAVLNLVNIYSAVVRTENTSSVLSEISSEIESTPAPALPARHGLHDVSQGSVRRAVARLGLSRSLRNKELPVPISLVPPAKDGHAQRVLEDVMLGSTLPKGCQDLFIRALGAPLWGSSYPSLPLVGEVHITHEPGLKTRYFAAPNQVVQRALEPLKNSLLKLLRRVPWDCTLDQRKADPIIRAKLNSGETVHSVDLSKATDNFPWEFQKQVLRCLQPSKRKHPMRQAIRMVDFVVRKGKWLMPDSTLVTWTKGQPLGLGPSFPLFTLSHGLLLFILNGFKWDGNFYVLGDDVVIFDDSLHTKYREVLSHWKLEISEAKSFSSSKIAQFAGVTYTEDSQFWVPKWRPITRSNLLDAAAWWYPGFTKGLKDEDIISRTLALPKPYGFGLNPLGIPLAQRLDEILIELLLEREQRRLDAIKPIASTRLDTQRLHTLWLSKGYTEALCYMLCKHFTGGIYIVEDFIAKHNPTGLSLRLRDLVHQATADGYPVLRNNSSRRVDPYTLGSLKVWKQTWKQYDQRSNPSEEII